MNNTESTANIISFPLARTQEKQINLPELDLNDILFESSLDEAIETSVEKEQKAVDAYLERTLKDFHLPPFVIKMRKVSSISNQIDHIRKLSKEIEYYLSEIEQYKK